MIRPPKDSSFAVTAKAPFRISLAGGGTDLPSYARRHGGLVVGLSINRHVEVSARASHDESSRVTGLYSEVFFGASDIESCFIRAAVEQFTPVLPVTVSVRSDVRPGAGLGGSGAFLNALCAALSAFGGDALEGNQLAEIAAQIEINALGRNVGKQDHYLSALGGCNLLDFDRNLDVRISEISLGPRCQRYFCDYLLLFDTGIARFASDVLAAQEQKLRQDDPETLSSMDTILSLVAPMVAALREDKPDNIGPLLSQHWKQKRLCPKPSQLTAFPLR